LTRVAILAAIVFILTFLSFSLEVETTGRWPWQKRNISAS
jgi:riboflavin transporter FmnP